MKPKYLNLRPNEVARFLRPSGLVVLPVNMHKLGIDFVGPGGCNGPNKDDLSCWGYADEYGRYWHLVGPEHPGDRYVIPCPLGGPGSQWVGREKWRLGGAFIDTKLSEFHDPADVLLNHVHYAADDIEEHFVGQYRSSTSMPLWATRIRKTTTRVELRRVRTITEAEAIEAGFEAGCYRSCGLNIPASALSEFVTDFNARYPGDWDRDDFAWFVRDDFAWFVFYTDTKAT